MSTLRRNLTQIEAANVADAEIRDDGIGSATLTLAGLELCKALFSAEVSAEE
jgi:hypothetical protein